MFKRGNFKAEHRQLLINTIGENETLFGKNRKFYQQNEKTKNKVKSANKIFDYQKRKLKLKNKIQHTKINEIPEEAFDLLHQPEDLLSEKEIDAIFLSDVDTEIKLSEMKKLKRKTFVLQKFQNCVKTLSRSIMLEKMKNNKQKWTEEDSKELTYIKNNYNNNQDKVLDKLTKKIDVLQKINDIDKQLDRVEKTTKDVDEQLNRVEKIAKDLDEQLNRVEKKVDKIDSNVKKIQKTLDEQFAWLFSRLDTMEKKILNAVNNSDNKSILQNMFLTQKNKSDMWAHNNNMKPFDFSGDAEGIKKILSWNEFQRPLVSWNALARVLWNVMTVPYTGDYQKFFDELGEAVQIWLVSIVKLVWGLMANTILASVSLFSLDIKSLFEHLMRIFVSIGMWMVAELLFGYSIVGYPVKTILIFVRKSLTWKLIQMISCALDTLIFTVTGKSIVNNTELDNLLYMSLRLKLNNSIEYIPYIGKGVNLVRWGIGSFFDIIVGAVQMVFGLIKTQIEFYGTLGNEWFSNPVPSQEIIDAKFEKLGWSQFLKDVYEWFLGIYKWVFPPETIQSVIENASEIQNIGVSRLKHPTSFYLREKALPLIVPLVVYHKKLKF